MSAGQGQGRPVAAARRAAVGAMVSAVVLGGAASAVREFRPAEVWEGIPVPPSPLLRDVRHAALAWRAGWRQSPW